eukprot:c3439_g1_i1 orf=72-1031(+)
MHRRTVSCNSAAGTDSVLLQQQKRGDHQYAVANRRPSRLKPAADQAAHGGGTCISLEQSAKAVGSSLLDDQIVCQSKLYDAFELQELDQQLERKLVLTPVHMRNRSCSSSSINDHQSPKCIKSPFSAYSLLKDHPSLKSKNADHLQAPSSSCKRSVRADQHEEKHASSSNQRLTKAARSQSMPRAGSHYRQMDAGDHSQAKPADAAQEQRLIRSNQMSQERQQRRRGSLISSFFGSRTETRKQKQDHSGIVQQEAPSTSSRRGKGEKQQHEVQHYVHHVHHHYHHHPSVHGRRVHFEEIDWPLSPARLQEIGWLMGNKS